MKCKMYCKNPVQYFILEGTKEVIANYYISDNELQDSVISIKRYGRVLKLKLRDYWGGTETIKIKSLSK